MSFFASKMPVCCFFLFLFCLLLPTAAFSFAKNRPLEAATLIYPPYEYLAEGQPTGLAVKIIREAAKRVGINAVNFNFYPWKRAVMRTETGEADLLFNAGKNEERQLWGTYADSVLILQKYYLFKRRGSGFVLRNDYKGMETLRIGVRRGYLYGSGAFRNALDNNRFKKIIYTDSTEQSVRMLLANRIDLFVGDNLPVSYYLEQQDLFEQIDRTQDTETEKAAVVLTWPTYLLFSKKTVSPEFVQEMSQALEEMKQDGRFQQLVDEFTPKRY